MEEKVEKNGNWKADRCVVIELPLSLTKVILREMNLKMAMGETVKQSNLYSRMPQNILNYQHHIPLERLVSSVSEKKWYNLSRFLPPDILVLQNL